MSISVNNLNSVLPVITIGVLVLIGCAPQIQTAPSRELVEARKAKEANQPRTRPAKSSRRDYLKNRPVASVNGRGLSHDDFYDLLVKTHGRETLDEWVLLEVVRQEAQQRGVADTQALRDAELNRLLDDMAPDSSQINRQAMLDFLLRSRGLTQGQLDIILKRRALLRQMVEQEVEIPPSSERTEFERLYGAKRSVRLIAAATLRDIERVQRELDDGGDFAELVRKHSEHQASLTSDGWIGPFSTNEPGVPEAIRTAAFDLQKPGRRSEPFQYLDSPDRLYWGIIQLEQQLEAEPVSFEDTRPEIRRFLREQELSRRMIELQNSLVRSARSTIYHPDLYRPE